MPGRVDSLLAEMPAKELDVLPSATVDRLRQMEPELPEGEEIRLIVYHAFPFGVAAITSSRLMIVLNDGGTKTTPYSEVSSFALVEGKKKLFGGYSQTMLMTRFRNQGESHTGYIGHDGQWGIRAGRELLAAQERYSVRNI